MKPRVQRHRMAGAALLAAMAGCASLGGGGEPVPDFGAVIVENDSPLTVTVYAVRHSGRFRLGTVSGLARREFPLKRHMLDTATHLQFLIEPLGGQNGYFTERIFVEEGEEVRLKVSNFIR
jgi:hypothetical protein